MILPYLPEEIWCIIFKMKKELEIIDSRLTYQEKWNLGWRPNNWGGGNWIQKSQDKRWNEMTFLKKCFWKLGIIEESKLTYWDNKPTWSSIFIDYKIDSIL